MKHTPPRFLARSLALLGLLLSACSPSSGAAEPPKATRAVDTAAPAAMETRLATFAGGCFWCMEPPFEGLVGVYSVVSGYSGGRTKDPSYKEVSAGKTGHAEAIQIRYNPSRVTYRDLVRVYLRAIDPTDAGGQFADRGSQYRPAIFAHDAEQERVARAELSALAKSGRFEKPLAVEVKAFAAFYPAEDYHQDYYRTHPDRYQSYRKGSGRTGFLKNIWNSDHDNDTAGLPHYDKPDEATLKKKLSDVQIEVTQRKGTEAPFKNRYWNSKEEGIYVDVVSGEPLFSSQDKYDSGTGWPSFSRPLVPGNVVYEKDGAHGMQRTEVRSKNADSHLGHVFEDGPPSTGLRYCMNSAALRFVPKAELKAQGYGEFAPLFEGAGKKSATTKKAGK